MKTNITQSNVESKVVLAKSLLNTADQLGLKEAQLASVIGVHCDTISSFKANPELRNDYNIDKAEAIAKTQAIQEQTYQQHNAQQISRESTTD